MLPTEWLKNFPEWLGQLANDSEATALGLVWLTEEEGQAKIKKMAELYTGDGSPLVPLPQQAREAALEMLSGKVVVAIGPKLPMRLSDGSIESLLVLDKDNPQELLLALNDHYPVFLWIPAGTTVATIQDAMSGYFWDQSPQRKDLYRSVRYFIGNERLLDTDIHGVENQYVASPFTAELSWGSAYADDPWPSRIEDVKNGNLMSHIQDTSRQAGSGIYSTTYRLQHSQGFLTLEDHAGMFVLEIRYQPCTNRDVLVGLNRRFGFLFPPDMPLDGVAAVLGLSLQTDQNLKDCMGDYELIEDHDFILFALAAVKYNDISFAYDLRPCLGMPIPPPDEDDFPGSSRSRPRVGTVPPPPALSQTALLLAQDLQFDFILLRKAAFGLEKVVLIHLDQALARDALKGWDGPSGPDLVIVGDRVARKSIDWLWGAQSWELLDEVSRGPNRLFRRTWQTTDGKTKIDYVEDHRLGMRFFAIVGEGRQTALDRIGSTIALKEPEAAISSVEGATDASDRIAGILKIARLAPAKATTRWLDLLKAGLTHEFVAVRGATLLATAYIGWLETIPLLEQLAADSLKAQAERVIAMVRSRNQPAS